MRPVGDIAGRIGAIARRNGLPDPSAAAPAAPARGLSGAIRAHGLPLGTAELYAANTVTPRELERMRDEADLEERRRRAAFARRAREDAAAAEWEASRVR